MDSEKQKQKRDLVKDLFFCDFLQYYWAESVFHLSIFLARKVFHVVFKLQPVANAKISE